MNILHLHLILNHIPVVGAAFLALLFGVAVVRRDAKLTRLGLIFAVLLATLTAAVYFTGGAAEEVAEDISGVSKLSISLHEEAAEVSTIAFAVTGLLALAALFISRNKPVSRRTTIIALALTLVVSGMLAWTANLGGNIRHTELQTATGPTTTVTRVSNTP